MAKAVDISRNDVRDMAMRNHRPTEEWFSTKRNDLFVSSDGRVFCQTCEQDWPCATQLEIEKYYAAHIHEQTGIRNPNG